MLKQVQLDSTNMKNKRLQTEINKLVAQSFKAGKADETFIAKVSASLAKLNIAEGVTAMNLYLKGLKRTIEENTLFVESAVTLSSTELKKVSEMLKKDFYAIEQRLNPSLLGGIKLKIGSQFIDLSLQSKISQMSQRIKGN